MGEDRGISHTWTWDWLVREEEAVDLLPLVAVSTTLLASTEDLFLGLVETVPMVVWFSHQRTPHLSPVVVAKFGPGFERFVTALAEVLGPRVLPSEMLPCKSPLVAADF